MDYNGPFTICEPGGGPGIVGTRVMVGTERYRVAAVGGKHAPPDPDDRILLLPILGSSAPALTVRVDDYIRAEKRRAVSERDETLAHLLRRQGRT